jgi:hypothetical protein
MFRIHHGTVSGNQMENKQGISLMPLAKIFPGKENIFTTKIQCSDIIRLADTRTYFKSQNFKTAH